MRVKTVVNSVESGGGEKYLVVSLTFIGRCELSLDRGSRELTSVPLLSSQLQEFGSNYESEMLRAAKKLALADILVFVYDSSDCNSFSYVSNIRVSRLSLASAVVLLRCVTFETGKLTWFTT